MDRPAQLTVRRDSPEVTRARGLLAEAERVVVLTGAGISAESGVPTFRGAGGLWRSHRPEELATPEAFARDPELVWAWYGWRRSLIADCTPNAGHVAIARFLAASPERRTLVTQNVDGLHTRAARELEVATNLDRTAEGSPPPGPGSDDGADRDSARSAALEIHGAIDRDRCSDCGRKRAGGPYVEGESPTLPHCSACGGILRPDVVWFGESLDAGILEAAFVAASEADVCLVAGTSAVVHPAASIPLQTLRAGGVLVEVNPDVTPLSDYAAVRLSGPSGVLLPLVLDPQRDLASPGTEADALNRNPHERPAY